MFDLIFLLVSTNLLDFCSLFIYFLYIYIFYSILFVCLIPTLSIWIFFFYPYCVLFTFSLFPSLLCVGTDPQVEKQVEKVSTLSMVRRDTALLLRDFKQGASNWIHSLLDKGSIGTCIRYIVFSNSLCWVSKWHLSICLFMIIIRPHADDDAFVIVKLANYLICFN